MSTAEDFKSLDYIDEYLHNADKAALLGVDPANAEMRAACAALRDVLTEVNHHRETIRLLWQEPNNIYPPALFNERYPGGLAGLGGASRAAYRVEQPLLTHLEKQIADAHDKLWAATSAVLPTMNHNKEDRDLASLVDETVYALETCERAEAHHRREAEAARAALKALDMEMQDIDRAIAEAPNHRHGLSRAGHFRNMTEWWREARADAEAAEAAVDRTTQLDQLAARVKALEEAQAQPSPPWLRHAMGLGELVVTNVRDRKRKEHDHDEKQAHDDERTSEHEPPCDHHGGDGAHDPPVGGVVALQQDLQPGGPRGARGAPRIDAPEAVVAASEVTATPATAAASTDTCSACGRVLGAGETNWCPSDCVCLSALYCLECWNRHVDRKLEAVKVATLLHRAAREEADRLRVQLAETQREREEWADALRMVAPGSIPSPVAARTAIAELKKGWDEARAEVLASRAEMALVRVQLEQAASQHYFIEGLVTAWSRECEYDVSTEAGAAMASLTRRHVDQLKRALAMMLPTTAERGEGSDER